MRELFIFSLALNIFLIYEYFKLKGRISYYLKDKYTAAYNYFFFDANFSRYLKPGGHFLFIDIDNFKKQNIEFGYDVADQLLKQFIDKLKSLLPDLAIIIRYKLGDEFVIILPETSDSFSEDLITKLKSDSSQFEFNVNEKMIHLDFTVNETYYIQGDTNKKLLNRLVYGNMNLKNKKGNF